MDHTQQIVKKRKDKINSNYSRSLLTRKVVLPITCIGKNLMEVLEEYVRNHFEGKCVDEGYIKPNSSKIIEYSSGTIDRGCNVQFQIVFECDICFAVEGMLLSCVVKNFVKAGIRAESSIDVPSPFVAYIIKDHHFASQQFNEIQVGDIITVRVIGQRFELNDKAVTVICELVKEKEHGQQNKQQKQQKPRLTIQRV